MAQGKPGADSSAAHASDALIQQATTFFGQSPAFWGRYFATSGSVEYRHADEDQPLAQAGIRLLPIARRTTDVGGSEQEGTADAEACVGDIFATFGADYLASQGSEFMVFIDVEGTPQSGSPSLSKAYYTGWATALMQSSQAQSANRVTLLPCVYGRQGDDATWTVLSEASQEGTRCYGAWVARYQISTCVETMPAWDSGFVTPNVALPCDLLIWQYSQDCLDGQIDCNQTNPGIDLETALLSKLIPTPDTSA